MKIIILGSGTCIPSKKRGSPGYYLEIGGQKMLIDPGSGTLHRLGVIDVKIEVISTIFFSHSHVDHTADLIPILFAKKNLHEFSRQDDIYLYGFKGFKNYFKKLCSIYEPWIISQDYNIFVNEFNTEAISFKNWSLSIKKVEHSQESVGFRFIENSKIFTFSGDSDYCKNLVELSRDADLAILECSFPESMGCQNHLTPVKAGKIASEAGVKKLVLTHLYPICDSFNIIEECKKVFPGKVEVAEDFKSYHL